MARKLRRSIGALAGTSGHVTTLPSVNYTPATAFSIPTYDGSGLCTEPSVVYFKNRWNGHRYWMAFVPIVDVAHENPSILCSDDGQNWTPPAGLTNPVIAARGSGNNADPELFYNPNDSLLYMAYIVQDTNLTSGVYVTSSSDGVTWSASTKLFGSTAAANDMLEPSIIWDGTQYVMYTVTTATNALQRRTSSAVLSGWSAPTTCTLNIPGGQTIWHGSVIREASGRIVLALCDNQTNRSAWLASSWDGLTFTVASRAFMTKPVGGFASSAGLYRPAIAQIGTGCYIVWAAGNGAGATGFAYVALPPSEIPV